MINNLNREYKLHIDIRFLLSPDFKINSTPFLILYWFSTHVSAKGGF